MSELKIELNRYDGRAVADLIKRDLLNYKGSDAWIVCEFGEDEEFEIHFEAQNGVVDKSVLDVAKSLMCSIRELDNKVLESCAAECKRTGLHPRNFEGMLAYIHVYPNRASLHYFGTGVNTEWDENVCLEGDGWKYIGVSKPNACV